MAVFHRPMQRIRMRSPHGRLGVDIALNDGLLDGLVYLLIVRHIGRSTEEGQRVDWSAF